MASRKPVAAEPHPAAQRILRAAFKSFTRNGYADTSTLDIATGARVSKRELYTVFGSKQAILVACIESRASRLRQAADFAEPRDRPMLESLLRRFGEAMLRELSHPTVVAMVRLAVAEAERSPEIARSIDRMGMQTNRRALVELFAKAQAGGLIGPVDQGILVTHFMGLLWGNLMFGMLLRVASAPKDEEIAARAERAARAFLTIYQAPGAKGRT